MHMPYDLKPCPCCGNPTPLGIMVNRKGNELLTELHCGKCPLLMSITDMSDKISKYLVDCWNTRVISLTSQRDTPTYKTPIIASFVESDRQTVVLKLERPDGSFCGNCTGLISKHSLCRVFGVPLDTMKYLDNGVETISELFKCPECLGGAQDVKD